MFGYDCIDILTLTVAAVAEPVTAGQIMGFNGAPAGVGEPCLGIAKYDAATGRPVAVANMGLVELEPTTNVAAGDFLYPDENGQPTTVGTENHFGIALEGGGVGDVIAVILK